MIIFCGEQKKHSDEFILLHVSVSDLGYISSCKSLATLFEYICKFAPPITPICLHEGWMMNNLKIRYLHHDVTVNQFCGRAVTGLNPITSLFYVSC